MKKQPEPIKAAAKKTAVKVDKAPPAVKRVTSNARTPKKSAAKKPRKSPVQRTQDIISELLDRVAERSLIAVCNDIDMPSRKAFLEWVSKDADLQRRYEMAMQLRADRYAEETITIADDGTNDTYVDDKGNVRVDQDVVARSKLRIDARKWYASKIAPKKYGDRVIQEIGGIGGAPIQTESSVTLDPSDAYLRMLNGAAGG